MRKQDLRFENFYTLNRDSELYFIPSNEKISREFIEVSKGSRLKFLGFGGEYWHEKPVKSYDSARKVGYNFPVFLSEDGKRLSLIESCKCLSPDNTSHGSRYTEMSALDHTLCDVNNRLISATRSVEANIKTINDHKQAIQKLESENSGLELKISSLREQIVKLTS